MSLISKQSITDYIPQKYPMVMVDTLESQQDLESVTTLTITKDSIFVINGEFREPGIIEHMAQTVAASAGYVGSLNEVKEPKIGYIGSVKKCKIVKLPKVGETIITTIIKTGDFDAFIIVECTSRVNNEVIGTAILNVFITDNI